MTIELDKHTSHGGTIDGSLTEGYRLSLPKMDGQVYSLAQLDNYIRMRRSHFPLQPPFSFELEARASGSDLPGTWGFGLWNDPFSMGLGAGGMSRILPVLPNAAWFFYASPENHLTLYDHLPGSGFLARTYRSPLLPGVFSLLTMLLFPLVISKWGRRFLRRAARLVVKEDAMFLDVTVGKWHRYGLEWQEKEVTFFIDGEAIFRTPISPRGKQGFALWMDNQYFRFDSSGRMAFGFLPVPDAQELQIRTFNVSSGEVKAEPIT